MYIVHPSKVSEFPTVEDKDKEPTENQFITQ